MSECYNCGKSGATKMLTINNSKQFDSPTHYITELDVPFDVDFGDGLDEYAVSTVPLCDVCHRNAK